jgi:hypothetical protein
MRFAMKKTLPMLAAAALATAMFSSDANALRVCVKTHVQTKNNNTSKTEQHCDYNTSATTQAGDKNKNTVDQSGKSNHVISHQTGDSNKFEGTQSGGSGGNSATITQKKRH